MHLLRGKMIKIFHVIKAMQPTAPMTGGRVG